MPLFTFDLISVFDNVRAIKPDINNKKMVQPNYYFTDHWEGSPQNTDIVLYEDAHVPATIATDITEVQYCPGGCTTLYDVMGRGLIELRPTVAKDNIALATVITVAYKNASSEFNAKTIKTLVESLMSQGWVFTYIGANQDVAAVAASMSIDNHLAFEDNEECTGAMFERECRSRKKFFSKV